MIAVRLLLLNLLLACVWDESLPPNQPPERTPVPLSSKVINGPEPENAAAFDELQAKGVKTIISVDGAMPNIEAARVRDMRYVHLPIGYDGIPRQRGLQLIRAIRDLPGPIYIHCHHGKHRSPTAAAYVSVALGERTPEEAIRYMKGIGTSEQYTGLYKCVAEAAPLDPALIEAVPLEYPEHAVPTQMVELMVAVDRSYDRLKQLRDNAWNPLPDHPDITPAQEAKILQALLAKVKQVGVETTAKNQFNDLAISAEELGAQLAATLQDRAADRDATMERMNQNCRACHKAFRDIPQVQTTNE